MSDFSDERARAAGVTEGPSIDAQLLVEDPDERVEERYAFRHALTLEAILLELQRREGRQIHRAVPKRSRRDGLTGGAGWEPSEGPSACSLSFRRFGVYKHTPTS